MKTAADFKMEQLHTKAKILLKQNHSEEEIIKALLKDGIDANYAMQVIANVKNDKEDKKEFWKLLFLGSFFIVGGLIINFYSYQIAIKQNSLFFYLFWGIIATGIVTLVKAFSIYKK